MKQQIATIICLLVLGLNSAVQARSVKFINFSDTHLAIKGKNTMKMGADSQLIVKKCVETANQMTDLDFVILSGDLLQDGEAFNLDMMRYYLDQLKVPYYVVLGNHDMSPAYAHDDPGPFFPAVSKSSFVWAFQGRGFQGSEFRWGIDPIEGIHLIGLDTTVPGTWGGHVPQKDLLWLDKEISNNQDKINIPIAHHNFIEHTDDDYDKTKNFLVDNAVAVRQIFEKYPQPIQFVISGHHHLVSVKSHQGVTYFSNPSTTTYPNMYTLYTLTEEQLQYESQWLDLPQHLLDESRQNLLADAWWRPTQAPAGIQGDALMLKQYMGEPSEQKGVIKLRKWRI